MINLESFDDFGVNIVGVDAEDSSGDAVNVGDINGDNLDDVLIMAPRGDGPANDKAGAGEAYVLFGKTSFPEGLGSLPDIDLRNLGSDGITIYGIDEGDGLTQGNPLSIASANIDGDAYDDLIIGVEWADSVANARNFAGEVWVIFGEASPPETIDLATDGVDLVIYGGGENDRAGTAVANAGYVNNDTYEDIIIAAPGASASYIIFGRPRAELPPSIDLQGSLATQGVKISGAAIASVSGAGDFDNDGSDDVILGAPSASPNGRNQAGESYLVYGDASLPSEIDLTTLGQPGGHPGITFQGIDGNNISTGSGADKSGTAVGGAGNVNDDRFADVIIGAPEASSAGNSLERAGEAYVIFGDTGLSGTVDLANPSNIDLLIQGAVAGDRAGSAVGGGADVNGDGVDDLIVGVPFASFPSEGLPGAAYVIHGNTGLSGTVDLSVPDATDIAIIGARTGDGTGNSVSLGNINGDQFADVVLGAVGVDRFIPSANRSGGAFIVFGSDFIPDINVVGNGRSITDGDVTPDLLDHTDFGLWEVDGETITRTYRIENTGTATLNLTGSPRVEISGASDFTVTQQPFFGSIDIGKFADFEVEFNPGAEGLREATITILSDDPDESPYQFDIQGTGTSGPTLDLANLGTGGVTIQSNLDTGGLIGPDGQLGQSVSIIGDVNGDEFDDMLIGAPKSFRAGRAYLIFGGPSLPGTIDLENLGSAGVLIAGAIPTNAFNNRGDVGYSVSGAGDVNNDGLDDLIIGGWNGRGGPVDESATGDAFIIFGRAVWPETLSLHESNNAADVTLHGAGGSENTGWSVSGAGDVNNDNYDDVIIGAYGTGNGTESSPGKSYIVYGGDSLPTVIQLASLGAAGVTIIGDDPDDNAGWSVSDAGDVDGDNFDDVIIGARNADDESAGTFQAGASYIVFGDAGLPQTIDLSSPGTGAVVIPGLDSDDQSGNRVSAAGDINGDGLSDVIIGVLEGDGPSNSRPNSGEAYVVFGRQRASWPATLDLASLSGGITIFGREGGYSQFGLDVTRAGDLNGDTYDDLVIQALLFPGGFGNSFVLFGNAIPPSEIDLAVTRADVLILDRVPVFATHLGGTGDINSDGFDDLLIGAPDVERFPAHTGSEGEAYLVYGGNLTGTPAPEMDVEGNNQPIADDSITPRLENHTNFGSVDVGTPLEYEFTIRNSGTADLMLEGTPVVEISGTDFSVTSQPSVTTLAPDGTTTFRVEFLPTAPLERTATISITNTDANENPYDYVVSGIGVVGVPNITVEGNGAVITDGDTTPDVGDDTDFGNSDINVGSVTKTYTIRNTGAAVLSLTGPSPVVIAPIASDFSVTDQPELSIPVGGSTTFDVTFDPTLEFFRTATVTISSDDPDPAESEYNFVIQGFGTAAPEIEVFGNGNSIADGDTTPATEDHTDFTEVDVAVGELVRTFTIVNSGSDVLNISNVSVSNEADFSVITPPASVVAANGGMTTFQIQFDPALEGEREGTVTITNNTDDGSYDYAVSGTGTVGTADIEIIGPSGTAIPSGGAAPSFGATTIGTGVLQRRFDIFNSGTGGLVLDGSEPVDISGPHEADFTVTTQPAPGVAAGLSSFFIVSFTPSAGGPRMAQVSIPSNDPDASENPYVFDIVGQGAVPDINVIGDGDDPFDGVGSVIPLGGSWPFGPVDVDSGTITQYFVIQNQGQETLNLTGTPVVDIVGEHESDFTVLPFAPPSEITDVLGAGQRTTFRIVFDPSDLGGRNAAVVIENDDPDESPFQFSIQGTGSVAPEIDVLGNGISITSGDEEPDTNDGTRFANTDVTSGSVTQEFTIRNTGSADLNLTNLITPVVLGTPHPQDFSVAQPSTAPIAPNESRTFQVTFNPTAPGLRTSRIAIANSDSDEGIYNFVIRGGAFVPEIDVQGNDVSIEDGDTTPDLADHTDFGEANSTGETVVRTFTIENTGPVDLLLTDPDLVTISGEHADDFSLTLPPITPVASEGGTTTFDITFDPTDGGLRTATITIANDDFDEDIYNFVIRGRGLAPEIDVVGNGLSIEDEDTTPDLADHTDFGEANRIGETVVRTFTIENTGPVDLLLTDPDLVTISGEHADDFRLTFPPTTPVASEGGTTTFDITFDPTDVELRTATITIANDDPDEASYEFAIQGTGFRIDEDTDGVDDGLEDAAPNDGDGNDDGTPDSQQANVTSLPNSADGEYLTLVSPDDTTLVDVQAIDDPSGGDLPPDVTFPFGFLAYELEGLEPGDPVQLQLIVYSEEPVESYYKFGREPEDDPATPAINESEEDHWYDFAFDGTTGAEIGDFDPDTGTTTITLNFVDGQRGDHDLTADGVIVDPGAPVSSEAVTPCLTAGPLAVGMNKMTYSCATPGGFVAFVVGTTEGQHYYNRWDVMVDIADPDVQAISVANKDGLATVYAEINEQQMYRDLYFQAFEMIPNVKASRLLKAKFVGEPPLQPLDVNRDGNVSTTDALAVMNKLIRTLAGEGESVAEDVDQALYDYDANGDGKVSSLDALNIINYIGRLRLEAEGAAETLLPNLVAVNPTAADSLHDDLIQMLADEALQRTLS